MSSKLYKPKFIPDPDYQVKFRGITFRSRIGAAAGISRNGEGLVQLYNSGFGFVEVGTVTPTRVYRKENAEEIAETGCSLVGQEENLGLFATKLKLKSRPPDIPIGANIRPTQENIIAIPYTIHQDYVNLLSELYNDFDYFVANISGVKFLKEEQHLRKVLSSLHKARDFEIGWQALWSGNAPQHVKPLLIKPGDDWEDWELLVKWCIDEGFEGLVLVDTKQGGDKAADKSIKALESVKNLAEGKLFIISVGGIQNGEDVVARIDAGADLVQIYSQYLIKGPKVVKTLTEEVYELLKSRNIK